MDLSAMGVLTIRTEVSKQHNAGNDALFYVRGSVNNAFIVAQEFQRLRHAVEIRENGEMSSFWICKMPSEIHTVISDRSCVDRCLRVLTNQNLCFLRATCSGSRVDYLWEVVRFGVTHGFHLETSVGTDLDRTVTVFLRRPHRAIMPVNVPCHQLMQMSLSSDSEDISMA